MSFILGILNGFLRAFVAFKIYGWYFIHTGFDLPSLTYLNVLALTIIIGLFSPPQIINSYITSKILLLMSENDKKFISEGQVVSGIISLLLLLVNYLIYIILF